MSQRHSRAQLRLCLAQHPVFEISPAASGKDGFALRSNAKRALLRSADVASTPKQRAVGNRLHWKWPNTKIGPKKKSGWEVRKICQFPRLSRADERFAALLCGALAILRVRVWDDRTRAAIGAADTSKLRMLIPRAWWSSPSRVLRWAARFRKCSLSLALSSVPFSDGCISASTRCQAQPS